MAQESAQLIVQLDGQVFQTLPLTMPVLIIGRAPDNDNGLALPHPLVSRRHAELRLEADGALLTDLNSVSGTFVAGTKILPNQPQRLTDGTVFQIGPFVLAYRSAPATLSEVPGTEEAGEEAAPSSTEAEPVPAVTQPVLPVLPVEAAPIIELAPPRPLLPAPLAQGQHSRYLQHLPMIFHDNDFLGRYLQIFETIWEPLEQREDHIAMYFDPRTCPASFLPWLASWMGLSFSASWPEMRVRNLLREAMELYRVRGTRYGLVRMIELCTGLTPTITEEPDQPFVIRVSLTIPAGSDVERTLMEELVRTHKPAHVGYVLEVQS